MSLLEKSVKNTTIYFFSQVSGLIFPIIVTPLIISKLGTEEFAIYTLVFGFIGGASLMDFSISSAFIKFISEHYYKNQIIDLNRIINTGFFYYFILSLIVVTLGYFLTNVILSAINIPSYLYEKAVFGIYVGLTIFFISNISSVFNALITSLQKIYITSIAWFFVNLSNAICIIFLLEYGFGLKSILSSQLGSFGIYYLLVIYFANKNYEEFKFSFKLIDLKTFKRLFSFGIQMQISKISTFASEKYDEFLLAYFSVLNFVTFFNIGARLTKSARFLPLQLIPQIAPVAAEFKSKDEIEKLNNLFCDVSRYMCIFSIPIFVYLFIFSNLIIFCWVGEGYSLSSYILKILIGGQLINILFSVPGNSITPNIGVPKYQMYEGLIALFVNLIITFILIKFYGIVGAAWGNTLSATISSIYVFFVSSSQFKFNNRLIFIKNYFLMPTITTIIFGILFYLIYSLLIINFIPFLSGRLILTIFLIIYFTIFFIFCFITLGFLGYFKNRDKEIFLKFLSFLFPFKFLMKLRGKIDYILSKVIIKA